MFDTALSFLVISISAAFVILLNYYKVPEVVYQEITAGLLLVIIIISNVLSRVLSTSKNKLNRFRNNSLILLSSTFVQILIVSTGGLFSPFFILFHLFVLTTSFLVNTTVSLLFLISVFVVIGVDLRLNPNKMQFLK